MAEKLPTPETMSLADGADWLNLASNGIVSHAPGKTASISWIRQEACTGRRYFGLRQPLPKGTSFALAACSFRDGDLDQDITRLAIERGNGL